MGEDAPKTTIVLGTTNPARESVVRAAVGARRVTVMVGTDCMAKLISAADLGIGACGVSAWERCALGLPAIVTVSAANQREDAHALHAMGVCWNLGEASAVTVKDWAGAIAGMCSDPARVASMSGAALRVLAGRAEAHAALLQTITSLCGVPPLRADA
jgi:spore coat polysaccharide biosynthesis predicted glycosyltransferase SpsG